MLAGRVDEAIEKRELKKSGGRAMLAAWNGFDASRPPVVLVHGISGSGDELGPLAQRLSSAGRQVLVLLYDDRAVEPQESGRQLAQQLVDLSRHYPPGTPLDIVGHSMGGIVSRAALNYLAEPGWMGESNVSAAPRAGFGPVRLRAIDTSWDGHQHEPTQAPLSWLAAPLKWLVRGLMRLFGAGALWQMRGSSDMFERLYRPRLEGVDIRTHAADSRDHVRAFAELDEREAHAVARFVAFDDLPAGARLRNFARALAQDARFAALRAELAPVTERLASESPSAELKAELVRRVDAVMPRFAGSHTGVLADGPGENDVTDVLVRELTGR